MLAAAAIYPGEVAAHLFPWCASRRLPGTLPSYKNE